jgi:hypothetical protein
MSELTNEWLENLNKDFSLDHIPHAQRPWLAWGRWAKHCQRNVEFGEPDVKRIFAWFSENSPSGAQLIGSFFTGLFYFDAHLWPVEIPLGYGTVKLDAMNALRTMPESIKRRLEANDALYQGFGQVWIDCIDYSMGIENLIKTDNGTFWARPAKKRTSATLINRDSVTG